MIRGPYRSYSSDFKMFIVANGQRNIPSHKNIPRSTIGSEGKCTAFAITAAMETLILRITGKLGVVLSPQHLWSTYGDGLEHVGVSVDDGVKAAETHLIALESSWPYAAKKPSKIDQKGLYIVTQFEEISLDDVHGAIAEAIYCALRGFYRVLMLTRTFSDAPQAQQTMPTSS